jgi:DNA-binding NarL/FixJ family response regulator
LVVTHAIRIAIVNDHKLFPEGVARSLGEIGVVREGASAEDAERLVTAMRPDILLLERPCRKPTLPRRSMPARG